jgi:T5SS/PEP-CTERM-associated repeat protein
MGSSLFVGLNGAANRLTVSNGAIVQANVGDVGIAVSSSNNVAVVTGAGSLWSNAFELVLGFGSAGNRLVISNGGLVRNSVGYVGSDANASNNLAIVTDPGSVWTNSAALNVGFSGASGGQLRISNGGRVVNSDGFIGFNATSRTNTVLVTGSGSTWSNQAGLFVGNSGSGNVLIASNGAVVTVGGNGVLGLNSGAISNAATVTGPGTSWLITSDFYVGSNGALNVLVVSNGASVINDIGFVGGSSGATNRGVVTGIGSIWNNRVGLIIGNQGGENRLAVSNGAMVISGFCTIGVNASSNNSVQVAGPGTVWSNALALRIGNFGSGNRVVVENGARLDTENASVGAFSANNEAMITGPGSQWSNRDQLAVGSAGRGNRLVVSNAAVMTTATRAVIGEFTASTNNRVVVDGGAWQATNTARNSILDVRRGTNVLNAGLVEVDHLLLTNAAGNFEFNGGTLITRGATISNSSTFIVRGSTTNPAIWDVREGTGVHSVGVPLSVGNDFSFNRMFITNGATLASVNSFIGANIGANSNAVLLSGSGSKWAAASLSVGYSGAFNRLVVSNGATAEDITAEIGFDSFSSNNLAVVRDAGSAWNNAGELHVGESGRGNQLVVSNGGFVSAASGEIGTESMNNQVLVMGAGSQWNNTGLLYVGNYGASNRLVVADGGAVRAADSYIGGNASASNNLALVTGAGSSWTNVGGLQVGNYGSGNLLVVTNGGTVFAGAQQIIGNDSGADSNTVIVKDVGSRWLGSNSLDVGRSGSFNRLSVSDGGFVASSGAVIGNFSGSEHNEALVSGAGSVWSNRETLFIGKSGSGNRVIVSEGARLETQFGEIGSNVGASNNEVVVTGPGSLWRIEQSINVGNFGSGNRLVVSNGARLLGRGTIGYATGSNNEVVVTGPGSSWTNSDLTVGVGGSGNRLLICDGGEVINQNFGVTLGAGSSSNGRILVDAAFCECSATKDWMFEAGPTS